MGVCSGEITNSKVDFWFKDGTEEVCFDLHVFIFLELLPENFFRRHIILKYWTYFFQPSINMLPLSFSIPPLPRPPDIVSRRVLLIFNS